MRVLFLALLFANVALFAWTRWVDVPPRPIANDSIERLPRLKLASEAPAAPAGQPTTAKPRATSLSLQPAPAQACRSVGPFADASQATRAATAMREKGLQLKERTVEGETAAGYWVYVGRLKNEDAAQRVLGLLATSGIKDAQLMPETQDGTVVSVGLFSERERAQSRARAVRKLGVPAEVAERKLPTAAYWPDVRGPGEESLVSLQPIAEGAVPGSHLQVQTCVEEPSAPAQQTVSSQGNAPTKIAASPGAGAVP